MKLYQRRPTYQAAQFDGDTDSLKEMKAIGAKIDTFTLNQDAEGYKTINIHGSVKIDAQPRVNFVVDIGEGDWMVIAENGVVTVVANSVIWSSYEKAAQ